MLPFSYIRQHETITGVDLLQSLWTEAEFAVFLSGISCTETGADRGGFCRKICEIGVPQFWSDSVRAVTQTQTFDWCQSQLKIHFALYLSAACSLSWSEREHWGSDFQRLNGAPTLHYSQPVWKPLIFMIFFILCYALRFYSEYCHVLLKYLLLQNYRPFSLHIVRV